MAIYHKDIIKFTFQFLSEIPKNYQLFFLNIYIPNEYHKVSYKGYDYSEYLELIKERKFCLHYIFEMVLINMDKENRIAGTEYDFLQNHFDVILHTVRYDRYFCCLTLFDDLEHRNQYKKAGFKMKYFKKAKKPDEKDKKKELIVI